MRLIVITLLLIAGRPGAFAQPSTNTTGRVSRFLEERLQRDPDDFIAAGKLGHTYLQKARESGTLDGYPKAEQMFQLVLKWTPDAYPAGVALGSALVSQHKFREAAALAGKFAADFPNEAPAYGVRGDALLELGDLAGAATNYARVVELSPGVSSFTRVARLEWLRGHGPEAFTNLARALEFSRSPPEALAWTLVQRGELFFRMGLLTEADHEYQAALEKFPGYYLALDHLAELRAARGKFDESVKLYQQLADRTQRPEYFQAIGDVLTAARKTNEAKPWHDRALAAYLAETAAGNVHYYHHLSGFLTDVREDGAEAERWARRDLEVRQNIYAWDALAWALYWKKDYAAAAEAMRKALATGAKDAHLFAHAGMIFVSDKKFQEGRDFMKLAAQTNPEYQNFHVHR